jgi:hypothetical protein
MKKSQNMLVWLSKMVVKLFLWPSNFTQFAEAGKKGTAKPDTYC